MILKWPWVADLREAYPDQIAGARIEDDSVTRAWVAFAGEAPAAAVGRLATFPQPVAIREHCGFAEAALKERLEEVHYAVWDRQDLVAEVSSGYDTETGVVTVLVEPRASLSPAGRAQLRDQLVAELPAGHRFSPVDIQVRSRVHATNDANVYGGKKLAECTGGFTVVGVVWRGITTAGHCSNNQTYDGDNLTFINQHGGQYGDVQWHRLSGGTHVNKFFASSTDLRSVNGTTAAAEGQRVCMRGRNSGTHCDNVYQLNHCNGQYCALVAMQNRLSEGGDSGGPWYFGNVAYGIHQGGKWWGFKWRDLYSPVVFLQQALGVSVATS